MPKASKQPTKNPRFERFAPFLGALLSACLCRFCTAPFNFWPALLITWLPFIHGLRGASPTTAALAGLVHGVVVNGLAFEFLVGTLHTVVGFSGFWSVVLLGLFIVAHGARSSLVGLGLVLAPNERRAVRIFWFPSVLVAVELAYPYLFPWYTGTLTHGRLEWMQLAEYGGPMLLTFWVGTVNAALALAWANRHHERRFSIQLAFATFTFVFALTLFGRARIRSVERWVASAPTSNALVVQGNSPPARLVRNDLVPTYRELSLRELERDNDVAFVVWPEGAIPYPIAPSRLRGFARDFVLRDSARARRRIHVPLLVGMSLGHDAPGHARITNSAVLLSPMGSVLGHYDKQALVPLSERPALPEWLRRLLDLPEGAELTPGKSFEPGSPEAISLGAHRLSLSMCYEDLLFAPFNAAVRRDNPHLLVNLTSDSWFGRSSGAALHRSLATFRAIEHRRYLLRSTTTGITSLVAPTGEVVWTLPAHVVATGRVSFSWLNTTTLYERIGDRPWQLLALIVAASAICSMLRRSRSERLLRWRQNSIHAEGQALGPINGDSKQDG